MKPQNMMDENEVCSCPPIASCEVHAFHKTSDAELTVTLRNLEAAVVRLTPLKSKRAVAARQGCEEMLKEVRAEISKREERKSTNEMVS